MAKNWTDRLSLVGAAFLVMWGLGTVWLVAIAIKHWEITVATLGLAALGAVAHKIAPASRKEEDKPAETVADPPGERPLTVDEVLEFERDPLIRSYQLVLSPEQWRIFRNSCTACSWFDLTKSSNPDKSTKTHYHAGIISLTDIYVAADPESGQFQSLSGWRRSHEVEYRRAAWNLDMNAARAAWNLDMNAARAAWNQGGLAYAQKMYGAMYPDLRSSEDKASKE